LAEGLILAEKFLDGSSVFYLLGDNVVFGHNLPLVLEEALNEVLTEGGAFCFGYAVPDPERFGVGEAGEFGATIEKRTGFMIGCIEEIAYRNGWIDKEALIKLAKPLSKTEYGKYLLKLVDE
jgi:dTDP-glucose pyrophosphorylase